MTMEDPRLSIARRAAQGARRQLDRIEAPRRPRIGRLTQQAINALIRVRNEVSLGASRKDLLDCIDDELYGLRNKKAAAPKGSGLT